MIIIGLFFTSVINKKTDIDDDPCKEFEENWDYSETLLMIRFFQLNETIEGYKEDLISQNEILYKELLKKSLDDALTSKITQVKEKRLKSSKLITKVKKELIDTSGGYCCETVLPKGIRKIKVVRDVMIGDRWNGSSYNVHVNLADFTTSIHNTLTFLEATDSVKQSYNELVLNGNEDPIYYGLVNGKRKEAVTGIRTMDFSHANFDFCQLMTAVSILSNLEVKMLKQEREFLRFIKETE